MLLSCSVQWCGVVYALPRPVCGGEYCGHVVCCLVAVSCGVVRVSMSLWCLCGGVSSDHSPLVVVVGGAFVDGGVA